MTLTTQERLTVDGVDMKTLCRNVETLAATLRAPQKRGANAVVSGSSGSVWNSHKPHAESTYTWPMWVLGCTEDGVIPTGSTTRREFYKRVDELVALFNKSHGLLDIRHTLPDGSVRQMLAECTAVLDFSTRGINPLGQVNVELTNPKSYFQDVNPTEANLVGAGPHLWGEGATAPLDDGIFEVAAGATALNNVKLIDPVGGGIFTYGKGLTVGQGLKIDAATSKVTGTGGHVVDFTKLTLQKTNGRLMRLLPDPVALGYSVSMAADSGVETATLKVTGRRKFLVG